LTTGALPDRQYATAKSTFTVTRESVRITRTQQREQ
jgi:hypothetical protein